jgi:TonB-linked SusC/RagA family outer membrane protein
MSSWAFRLNYNYKNRYLLTATVRWDGSSKFAQGNRWGSFPSVALAWRVTEEEFMKNINWLSNLKLRLSYGVTGNCDGIGNYAYATSATTGGYYYYNGQYVQGKYLSSLIDKDLKWEKSYEWNFGLDFGFFDNRINGSIELYNKTSKDLLYNKTTPLTGATITTNIGEVNNKGIELSLNGVIIKKKDFTWNAGLTFSTNKNEVKKINGEGDRVISSNVTTGSLFVGHPVNNVYGYELQGIVSDRMMTVPNSELATNNGFTPGNQVREYDYYYKVYGLSEGQPIIVDANQDGKIDDNDRKIFDADPSCAIGFNTSVTWKNWDFSMSLYSKINSKAFSATLEQYLNYSDRGRNRIDVDYYIPAGALIDADGYNADGTLINPVYQQSTHYGSYAFPNNGGSNGGVGKYATQYLNAVSIEQVGFCKIKNITLGYTFPKNWINKFGCQHLRLYCTVTNPFVFTKFKGFDPEWAGSSLAADGTPSTITWQIGASVKF